MENHKGKVTTDSTCNRNLVASNSVKTSVSRRVVIRSLICTVAFMALIAPTAALGQGDNATITSQTAASTATATKPAAEPTDTKTAENVAAKALPSVVSVMATKSKGSDGATGSGVILNANGDILTNYHVIEGMDTFKISIGDTDYDCTVVGSDPSSDLAVLHADLKGASVTPIEVGNSDELTPGSWVMSVGSPFGLDHSVSAGIVSALSRGDLLQTEGGETTIYANLIQVDAAINPGNSGGALVDSNGKLVGICTLFSSDTKSFAGIGFAIPGNYAIDIANQILSGNGVKHAYIGLSMQTVNTRNARRNNLSVDYGAYVVDLLDDSPAKAAGIKEGDVIVSIGGERVTSADAAIIAVRSHKVGETVSVEVVRGEEHLTFDVTLSSDEALSSIKEKNKDHNNSDNTHDRQDQTDETDDDQKNYRQKEDMNTFWDYFMTSPDDDSNNPFSSFIDGFTNTIAQVIYNLFN